MKSSAALMFFVILILISPGSASPQEKEFIALGSARISKSDIPSARTGAVNNALMKALEAYLISRLGQKTVADNLEGITSVVIPAAREATANYSLLAEKRTGETITVLVSMRVNESVVDSKLSEAGVKHGSKDQASILLVISETVEGKSVPTCWWREPGLSPSGFETMLYSLLRERGFEAAFKKGVLSSASAIQRYDKEKLDDSQVLELGAFFLADIVVHGAYKNLEAQGASMEMKILETSSGKVLWTGALKEDKDSSQGVFASKTAELITTIVGSEKVAEGVAQLEELVVCFNGVTNAGQIQRINSFLRGEVRFIKGVTIARVKKDSACFRVICSGSVQALIKTIVGTAPYRTDLISNSDKEVILRLVAP